MHSDQFVRLGAESRRAEETVSEIRKGGVEGETSAEFVLLVNVEGSIQQVDEAAEPVLGYAPVELIHTSLFRHIYEHDLLPVFRGVVDLVQGREQEVEVGFHFRTAGGLWRSVRASMQARCQGQAVVGILLTLHPVLTVLG